MLYFQHNTCQNGFHHWAELSLFTFHPNARISSVSCRAPRLLALAANWRQKGADGAREEQNFDVAVHGPDLVKPSISDENNFGW